MTQAEEIYKILRDELIMGSIEEGTLLRENEIAKRFKVSRTPIREALRLLASEKFIRIVPKVGYIVGVMSWDEAREVFAIRQILEAYAGGLAAKFITDSRIEEAENLFHQMRNALECEDGFLYSKLDEEFHDLINGSCENNSLVELIKTMNDKVKLSKLRKDLYSKGRMQRSLRDHRRIIDAIRARNSRETFRLILEHGDFIFGDVSKDSIREIFGLVDGEIE